MHCWSILAKLIILLRCSVVLSIEKVVVTAVYKERVTRSNIAVAETEFKKKHGYSVFSYQKQDPSAPHYFGHNRGSETGIYLKYIVDHYENFPDVAIFVYAHPPQGQPSKWFDVVNCISPNTSWYNMDGIEGTRISHEPGNWGPNVAVAVEQCWRDVLQTTWDLTSNKAEFNRRLPRASRIMISTTSNNQFILSREMVHKRPLHVWSALLNILAIQPVCHKGEPEYEDLFEYHRNGLKVGAEETHQSDEENRKGNLQAGAGECLSHVIFGQQPLDMAYPTHKEMCENFLKGCPGSPCRQ